MPRAIISPSETEKDWLTRQAEAEQIPMPEIVRRALLLYPRQTGQPPANYLRDELLQRTRGIWSEGEGLDYQTRIRSQRA